MKERKNALAEELNLILKNIEPEGISLRALLYSLSGKGQALLLILMSLPFCQPISLPGFSTILGFFLAFVGLRISFGHQSWLPSYILDRKISKKNFEKIASFAIYITNKLKFFIRTRLVFLVENTLWHIFHGLTITLLAILLALPLPIPFSNLLCGYPILFFGLGLLEEDGVMIILAYIFAILCVIFFLVIAWLGIEGSLLLIDYVFSGGL